MNTNRNRINYRKSFQRHIQSEEDLHKLSSQYDAILAAIPDIIMEVDANKIYTWANQAGLDFFGSDVLGKDVSYYFEGEQDTLERVKLLFDGDESVFYVESWQRRKDGEKRLLAWWCQVLKDASGTVTGAISSAHDITDRRQIEEQIRLQNQLFERTIESLSHPFYVIDANDYTIKIANTATAFLGSISGDTTCHALTHNSKQPCRGMRHTCPLREIKKTKKPVTLEHIHFDKEGNARHVEIHGFPIFDDEGNVIQMIEYSLDITERKILEEELQRSRNELENRVIERTKELIKANDALRNEIAEHKRTEKKLLDYQQKLRSLASDLTLTEERERRRIATDLHDSIGQALALSKMKLSEIRHSSPDTELCRELDEIYGLLERTIQDTRSLTFKISLPILYELGLESALEWLTEKFQMEHGIQANFIDDGESKPLDNDIRIVLFRTVQELLFNVAKHANAKKASVTTQRNGNNINIKISDDGIGFESSKFKGTKSGFGLFSIRERLDFLGGKLKIESKPEQGTRITLEAPLNVI
jgi:PAS domain S-box-containing protein